MLRRESMRLAARIALSHRKTAGKMPFAAQDKPALPNHTFAKVASLRVNRAEEKDNAETQRSEEFRGGVAALTNRNRGSWLGLT